MEPIEKYFGGERLQCTIGLVYALLCIVLSVYMLYLDKVMMKGLAYTLIPTSALLLIICVAIVVRTPKDVQRVTTFYTSAPEKMQSDELPRMQEVMNNFTFIKKIEAGLFIASLMVGLVFWKNELVRGIAIGLMAQSAVLFLFDYLAAIRGKAYLEFLQSL
jgi:hypothetical protein